jgi:hypothetical protein
MPIGAAADLGYGRRRTGEPLLDTLKLTKRLEDAGLERRVAEAMPEAFAEGTVETVATKQDMRELEAALRAELKAETQALRTEMAALAQNLRTEIEATAQNLRAEMQTFRGQVIAAVALMLLVHLGGVWGIVAAHAP